MKTKILENYEHYLQQSFEIVCVKNIVARINTKKKTFYQYAIHNPFGIQIAFVYDIHT